MNSLEIRKSFLDYFAQREHRVVSSSPLVLPNDATLLFANAGMNQFKELFTGTETRDYVRAASSQKCLRVSGKHNDLEMVGRTPRHQTFFEMLGNFSFGDYFKREAIRYAWELLTEVYGLPQERLWVTVFRGTAELEADDEARRIWLDEMGVREDRLLGLGESENFWRMGDTGPCGPCSEIHYDLGEDLTSVSGVSTPENDDRRYVELWNLVFMQFDQQADGARRELPAQSIDTGMGLERIASVLAGKRSNYDTDLFQPILAAAATRAGTAYGKDEADDLALRVIADHTRAFCFMIADGVVPANDRRGYVLRRLLRRAIRFGRKLGIDEPFLHEITPVVLESLGPVYPELEQARDAMLEIGRREERRFADTLSTGMSMLETALDESGDEKRISGGQLFKLHDTFGFPLDLARDIAAERGIALDEEGFRTEMEQQRRRAQASWKGAKSSEAQQRYAELDKLAASRFVGYEADVLDGVPIVAILGSSGSTDRLEQGHAGELILEATPFYAESGGQVGDSGMLSAPSGRAGVTNTTRPLPGLIAHTVRVETGSLSVGDRVHAEVDRPRREAIRRNHTATHLLHAALREVLGTHVKQAGSLVADDRLRFDFSHFAGVAPEALADIESIVNERVLENLPVEIDRKSIEEALQEGAMALFGEKYGDEVRTVRIGDFSYELCGGLHCERSGAIGLVKLVHERGVASGTRRIEALSGTGSLRRFRAEHGILADLEGRLAVPRERLAEEIERRSEQLRALQKRLEQERLAQIRARMSDQLDAPQTVDGVKFIAERADNLASAELRELADTLRGKLASGVVVLGRADGAKASLLVAVTPDMKGRVPAGKLVRELARIIGGGGGGRPDLAEAGGKEPGRLDEALQAVPEQIRNLLEASRAK